MCYKVEIVESSAFVFIAYVFCAAIASVISLPSLILVFASVRIEVTMSITCVMEILWKSLAETGISLSGESKYCKCEFHG